jgi:signal transduction histidine kinase
VSVTDDGGGAVAPGPGNHGSTAIGLVGNDGAMAVAPGLANDGAGVIGMRERAVALGGTLDAGPRNGGGFAVIATLPVLTGPAA